MFFFIATAVVFYFLIPNRIKVYYLLFLSCLWYASWGEAWSLFFLSLTFFNLIFCKIEKIFALKKIWTWFYPALIGLNLSLFVLFKHVNPWPLGSEGPLGISFYFLSLIGMLVDVMRSDHSSLIEKKSFLLMPVFFPAMLSGPVLRSKSFFSQTLNLTNPTRKDLLGGSLLFFIGYFKIQLLLEGLNYWTQLFLSIRGQSSFWFLAGCFLSTFTTYLQLSSYCDMGRGAARCFGIDIGLNFKAFYYSKSPADFWSRWNISLGQWLRDYFSFPLLLKFGKKIGAGLILLASFFLVGLWHGTSNNWLLFGLLNGSLVLLYFFVRDKIQLRHPKSLALIGYFLAFMLYAINGLLSSSFFLDLIFSKVVLQPKPPDIPAHIYITCLLVLLIYEYFQEKFKNYDFVIGLGKTKQLCLLLLFFGLFLFQLHEKFFLKLSDLPPIYFNF